MFEKKCPGCGKKIEREFSYCPWCGTGIKEKETRENYGLLGKDDIIMKNMLGNSLGGLPINSIISSLTKQIEKEMANMNLNPSPSNKGFSIKIATSMPGMMNPIAEKKPMPKKRIISAPKERKEKYTQAEPESKIKRIGDKILYEIKVANVKGKSDIEIKELEQGFEIKIYSGKICYTKVLPIDMELASYSIEKDKVVFEFESE